MGVVKRCKLSINKQKHLLMLFEAGCTGRAAARLVCVNRMTALLFFRKLRRKIHESRGREKLSGVVEIDECYTSSGKGGRKAARRGRNLDGKLAFVGAISRESRKVIIERVQNTKQDTLNDFIERNVKGKSIIHTDSFKAYNGVKAMGYKHLKVNHFLTFKNWKTKACTNLIESCWAVMRRHLNRFCGGFRNNLHLWIAEIEFRIENKDLHRALRKVLRTA